MTPDGSQATSLERAELGALLENAAAILERYGWCQGVEVDDDGRLCAIAALMVAAGADYGYMVQFNTLAGASPAVSRAAYAAGEVVERHLGIVREEDPGSQLAAWSDAPRRTRDEVVTAFREAAASCGG